MPKSKKRTVYLLAEQLRARVPGGIGTHTASILSALSNLKPEFPTFDLQIVATKRGGGDPLELYDIPVRILPYGHGTFMKLADAGVPVLGKKPGIYHSFSMLVPPVFGRSQRRVTTVHDLAFVSNPSFFTGHGVRWHSRQLRRISRGSDPVVTVSRDTADSLESAGIGRERIRLIESGADHLDSGDFEGCQELLESIGISGDFILSVSTLEPRKNLSGLLDAYRMLRMTDPSVPELVVAGPRGWKTSNGDVPGVHFVGHVPGGVLSALYRMATLLVYVPFEEGFGLPVVEAMASGLPVVSSNVPSAGGATQLVDPTRVDSIVSGILKVTREQNVKRLLIEEGFNRVADLTWLSAARKHMELWEGML